MGEYGVAEASGNTSGEAKGNLLAADGFLAVGKMTVRGDPCAQAGFLIAVDFHKNSAAGVFTRQIVDDA
jgi:hypothetical protein